MGRDSAVGAAGAQVPNWTRSMVRAQFSKSPLSQAVTAEGAVSDRDGGGGPGSLLGWPRVLLIQNLFLEEAFSPAESA